MTTGSSRAVPSWLGIDLGGTFLKWEHLDGAGETIGSGRTPTPTSGEIDVAEALALTIESRLLVDADLGGVGIAVPGHLAEDRESITLLPNVSGVWPGFALASWLSHRTGIRPVLLNDARAFAAAELALGAARDDADVVFATIGTGVGGAVAVSGAVVSSRRDAFGEIGHTTAVIDGDLCTCGSRGCVEAYAGGSAVLRRAALRGVDPVPGADALTDLLALSAHDPTARAVLDEAYDAFAAGVATVCAFTGARVIVVGGAVAAELPSYLDRSRVRLAARRDLLGDVVVRPAVLGPRAGAIGAALTARAAVTARASLTARTTHTPPTNGAVRHPLTTLEHQA